MVDSHVGLRKIEGSRWEANMAQKLLMPALLLALSVGVLSGCNGGPFKKQKERHLESVRIDQNEVPITAQDIHLTIDEPAQQLSLSWPAKADVKAAHYDAQGEFKKVSTSNELRIACPAGTSIMVAMISPQDPQSIVYAETVDCPENN